MRNRSKHKPQIQDEEAAYYQEILKGEDIPNQWSLKLRKIESLHLPHDMLNNHNDIVPIDVQRGLLLTENRTASITYDVSMFRKYSICIINESDEGITFSFELSPNNINFIKKSSNLKVKPRSMECVSADEYLKYARISVKGDSAASVIIYLQGYK